MATATATCPAPSIGALLSSTFTQAVQLVAAAQCLISEKWPQEATDVSDGDWYDFVVVGASTAGSVVASRLSENQDWSVLLIDAGGDPPQDSIVPMYAERVALLSQYLWKHNGEKKSAYGQGLANGVIDLSSAKMLGGRSSLNMMTYLKGVTDDYQQWYNAGNKEWHPDEVAKSFKMAESLQDATLLKDPFSSVNYGTDGPVAINRFNTTKATLTKNVLTAYQEIGIKNVPDLNSASLMGSGRFTAMVANGQRVSTATAYLNSAKDRPNLKILKNTVVTKILIGKENKLAYGVEAQKDGQTVQYFANAEVIVSTGVILTPQLLKLSGIGAEKELLSNKIDSIVHSPGVGKNLIDQTVVPVPIFADAPVQTNLLAEALSEMRYVYDRTGLLADIVSTDVAAFYANDQQATIPDFQTNLAIFRQNSTLSYPMLESFVQATADDLKNNAAKKALFLFNVANLRPASRGRIALKNKAVNITPGYFTNKKDIENIVAGLKTVSSLVNTSFFKSINAKLGRMACKACDDLALDSNDYWKCIATNFAKSSGIPAGTVKMGTDYKSPVNSRLIVKGLTGVRVVDESVMPTVPSCVSDAPIIMLAERASALIKEDNTGDGGSLFSQKKKSSAKVPKAILT